ncbi:MAG TPA: hypothetical protein VGG46_13700 [Terriglobales bacterium]|jgi:hypothetical protein
MAPNEEKSDQYAWQEDLQGRTHGKLLPPDMEFHRLDAESSPSKAYSRAPISVVKDLSLVYEDK